MNRAAHVEIPPAPAEKALRRLNFTDRTILALKTTAKLADYWDSSMPGFGIRVAPSGLKTWIVMYRRPSGNASRMKLGSYPAVALADARLAARRALGGIQIDHRDPMSERAAERNAETFAQLADEYLRRWAKQVSANGRPRKTEGPHVEIQKAVQRLRKRSGFGFTAHDLRRTAATLMADAGVPENIIPKILNHKEAGVTRRHTTTCTRTAMRRGPPSKHGHDISRSF